MALLTAVLLVPQWLAPGPISDRCAHRSDGAQYIWHHLEWRWAPVAGRYCVWTDTGTGELVVRYALLPMPSELDAPG